MHSPDSPSSVPLLDPATLPFAASSFDRNAVEREVRDLRREPGAETRVLVSVAGRYPVLGGRLVLVRPGEAPEASPDPAHPEVYLGRLQHRGRSALLRSYPDQDAVPVWRGTMWPGVQWVGLREIGTSLDPEEVSLVLAAQSVGMWHRDHPRCPRCGTITDVIRSGWARRCPREESLHFPRTDPAVIVAVTDHDPDPDRERILLGRSALWRGNRFSTLAGFVEPGESAEHAVARELREEAGITVRSVHYQGSQPWPFPRSLMLGFRAVTDTPNPVPDGTEILELRWFTREELVRAARDGQIVLPGPISISHALIVSWLGAPLPESGW